MLGKLWQRKKAKILYAIVASDKAKEIARSSSRILGLAHELQDEYDLTETEMRLVFLNICEGLAKNKVTQFHRGSDGE